MQSSCFPKAEQIQSLVAKVGWHQVDWQAPTIQLAPGMEVDFGGVAKEYAVDRVLAQLVQTQCFDQCLVNFGGDLAAYSKETSLKPWMVGIENPDHAEQAVEPVALYAGALATSGSTRRFLQLGREKYGHILNPKTSYPIEGAPLSVTVQASSCTEAGMLATFAMLHGREAETFLASHDVTSWVIRG